MVHTEMQPKGNKSAWRAVVISTLSDFIGSDTEANKMVESKTNSLRIDHMFEDGISAKRAALGLMPANSIAGEELVNKAVNDFKTEFGKIAQSCEHTQSMFGFVERRLESIRLTRDVSFSWLSLQLCDGEFLMNMAIAGSSNIDSRSNNK